MIENAVELIGALLDPLLLFRMMKRMLTRAMLGVIEKV